MNTNSENSGLSQNLTSEDNIAKREIHDSKEQGIADQGTEWINEKDLNAGSTRILDDKADKYLKDSADIEDLPEEEDEQEAEDVIRDYGSDVAGGSRD